ncbi:MAG: IS3 family transposase, partial [Muribaculaceae bacterium]
MKEKFEMVAKTFQGLEGVLAEELKVLEADDAIFREQISAIFEQSGFRFGIKKIRAKMIQKGYMISERRISRIMKEAGIQPPKPLEKNATFRRQYRYYPNRLNRKFEQPQPNMA